MLSFVRGVHFCRVCAIAFFATVLAVSCVGQTGEFEKTFHEGVSALRAGQWQTAETAFTRCTELRPNFAGGYFNLGLVRLQEKSWDEALTSFGRALKLSPDMRGANMFAGVASYRLNEYPQAMKFLEREVRLDPSNATAYMWLGVTQMANGDPDAAGASLDKANKLKPNDVDILYHRGRAHMLISKESYEDLYKTAPDSWRVHEVLAESFSEAERYGDAINECREALRLKPDEPGLHEEMGDIYWKQNQLPQAEGAFQDELKQNPENTSAMYKLAVVSIERSKPDAAESLLEKYLERDPQSADGHYQLGRAQAQLGDNDAAIRNFVAAVADSGNSHSDTLRQSYYQLAQLYRKVQRPEDSRAALNSFLRLKQEADAQQAHELQDKLKRSMQLQDTTHGP